MACGSGSGRPWLHSVHDGQLSHDIDASVALDRPSILGVRLSHQQDARKGNPSAAHFGGGQERMVDCSAAGASGDEAGETQRPNQVGHHSSFSGTSRPPAPLNNQNRFGSSLPAISIGCSIRTERPARRAAKCGERGPGRRVPSCAISSALPSASRAASAVWSSFSIPVRTGFQWPARPNFRIAV